MKPQGIQRIAAVLLSLDKEVAAQLLRTLPTGPLDYVTQSMLELSDQRFTTNDAEPCLAEFWRRLTNGDPSLNDFHQLLRDAIGEDSANAQVRELAISRKHAAPFAPLEHLPPKDVAEVLEEENEQVCAVILSQVKPTFAAQTLRYLDEDLQNRIFKRIAHLRAPSMELLEQISESILHRLGPVSPSSRAKAPGLDAAAAILNYLDSDSEQKLTQSIQDEDEELFRSIDERRLTMEDLIGIDQKSMQKVLSGVDTRALTLALKGIGKEVEGAILANVSKRTRETILEEREILGPVPVTEVEQARQDILGAVRAMVKSGDVVLNRGDVDVID